MPEPADTLKPTAVVSGSEPSSDGAAPMRLASEASDAANERTKDHPASVWTGQKWERVVAAIMEDGSLLLMPEAICHKCVLLLTAREWADFPKPPNRAFKWDFKREEWVDRRESSWLKKEAALRIRNTFEGERWRAWGAYVPDFETSTWPGQVREAEAFLADASAETPGIDAYLMELGANAPQKTELCRNILQNNRDYMAVIMAVNGRQRHWLNRLEACQYNEAIDVLVAELDAFDQERIQAG